MPGILAHIHSIRRQYLAEGVLVVTGDTAGCRFKTALSTLPVWLRLRRPMRDKSFGHARVGHRTDTMCRGRIRPAQYFLFNLL